jgi:uncharacterized protein (TIGR03435 family)
METYRLICALIPAAFVITGAETIAQPAEPARPQFEVGAVKPGDARLGAQMNVSGRRFVWENITLRDVIEPAYHIGDWQIQGAPGWMDTDPFAFEAVMPEGYSVRVTPFHDDRLMAMMQRLVEDRFKLKFHWQPKEGRVYSLAVAKGGPRFKPSEGADSPDPNQAVAGVSYRRGFMKGNRATMAQFAQALSDVLDHPVEDQTGIKGSYDFTLEYSRGDDDGAPSLLTAIPKQLGLRLNARKGQAQIFVIDHVEKPGQN